MSCVGIAATVWLRLTVPFSTVVIQCASASSTVVQLVVPPMTKMDSQLMGTTATVVLGLDNDATLLHDCFNSVIYVRIVLVSLRGIGHFLKVVVTSYQRGHCTYYALNFTYSFEKFS